MRAEELSESPLPARSAFRAPLLWILLPQIFAYVLCECGFAIPKTALAGTLALALACALIALVCAIFEVLRGASIFSDFWKIALPAAAFFLAGTWWSANAPELLDWAGRPESEAKVCLRVETVFRSLGKSWSGLARVESASALDAELAGTRVLYQFSKKEISETPHEGMRLRLRGIARDTASEAWLDAEFREFLIARRAGVMLSRCDCVEVLPADFSGKFSAWCARQKQRALARLVVAGTPYERESRVLAAMVFGESRLLFADDKKNFTLTGTMHIFAISGLHVALLGGLLFSVFVRLRAQSWIAATGTLALLWLYVQIAGDAPSAMRAWTMIAFLFLGRALGRQSHPLLALVLAGTVALWREPALLGNLGFLLSYGAVSAILLYGVPVNDFILARWQLFKWVPESAWNLRQRLAVRAQKTFVGLFAISLAAFLGTSCFLMSHFDIFTPLGVLVNLVVVPATGVLLGLAVFAVAFCTVPVVGDLAFLAWELDCVLMRVVEIFTGLAATLPAHLEIGFERVFLGNLAGTLMLAIFVAGTFSPAIEARPCLRFAAPPVFLAIFLCIFAR